MRTLRFSECARHSPLFVFLALALACLPVAAAHTTQPASGASVPKNGDRLSVCRRFCDEPSTCQCNARRVAGFYPDKQVVGIFPAQALDPKPLDLKKFLVVAAEFIQRSLGETVQIEKNKMRTLGAEGNGTVLVVEDDAEVRAYLSEALRNLNDRAFTAPNMETGLDVLRKRDRIDLLLTDIVMPGGNGRELATQAATLRPDLHILFMTGYSRNAVVHHGRLDEGVDLLHKPISQAELATRIRAAFDRNRQR
jgi:CheY-like chemotaxis protein